jgi:hypothetical protein
MRDMVFSFIMEGECMMRVLRWGGNTKIQYKKMELFQLELFIPAPSLNAIRAIIPTPITRTPQPAGPRHGNHRVREFSASRGWVLLLLFLPTKKSKKNGELPMATV